jgi:antitoxin component of MazEF toxin-antitoxin module
MSAVVRPNENGELVVPRELVSAVTPHEQFEVGVQGNVIVARPVRENAAADLEHLQAGARRLWSEGTQEERVMAIREWIDAPRPPVPHLRDEALSRENIYD